MNFRIGTQAVFFSVNDQKGSELPCIDHLYRKCSYFLETINLV